ncbi:MAG: endonuclease/exonuclease/phosphatase family protein [Alteromonadaceae bacterium]|nr:endonuclease/exonuclease/phosphatase family protein [Alteromonadaceae bacterium]
MLHSIYQSQLSVKKAIILSALLPLSFSMQAETLKVASWNIAWLGSHQYNIRVESDYRELARYAKKLNADIIALQEVENAEYARIVFGDDYDYYFSTKDWVQRVGVAVRKSKGYSVQASEYKALDVGRVRYGMDVTLTKGSKEIRLLAVHLKSGCFEKKLDSVSVDSMKNASKREKQIKTACIKLSKQLKPLEKWIDQRASQGIPYIILGDFNRRFSKDIALNHSEKSGLWQAIDDEDNEDLWTPTLNRNSDCWGGYYKDYIDHIVLGPKAKKRYIDNSFNQLVFDQKYTKNLANSLSDHCPISIELDL